MPETIAQRPEFAAMLQAEVDRILLDPAFERSPVQSRLLSFLCKETIDSRGELTQFAIAVEGLGRPEDYDLVSESYPRVQISRLRQNLAEYYSRVQPGDGLCVFLRRGDYKLRLAPHEKAYPREPATRYPPPEPDAAPSSQSPLGQAAPVRQGKTRGLTIALAGIALALVALAAWFYLHRGPQADATAALHPPRVDLSVTNDIATGDTSGLATSLQRLGQAQIAASFIARPVVQGDSSPPDFSIRIGLGQGLANDTEASVALVDRQGGLLATDVVVYNGDREAFLRRVSASLANMLRPSGTIADATLENVQKPEQSDFACHLSIEATLATGTAPSELLDRCLSRFPKSDFVPYWEARKALLLYQRDVAEGRGVVKQGPAWDLVRDVFARDSTNAYGNVLMAKIEYAEGRCDLADRFGTKGMMRGVFYPSLYAMHLAERSGCGIPESELPRIRNDLIAIAETNPSPDPLLRLYLVLASDAIGLRKTARETCNATELADRVGVVGDATGMICQAMADPAYLKLHRDRVRKSLALFVWNAAARDAIMRGLEAPAGPENDG